MQIIFKYLLKSITEKKFRTFLVILAITLSGSLFFASTSLSDSLIELYTTQMHEAIGNAEIKIYANPKSPSPFISTTPLSRVSKQTEYVIKTLQGSGLYKTGTYTSDNLSITGIDLEDYETYNTLSLSKKLKNESFEGYSIIISNQTAQKYNLDVGDTMELTISGAKRKFTIYGLSNPIGLFSSESTTALGLIPFHTLSLFQSSNDKASMLYIRSTPDVDLKLLLEELKNLYPKYEVKETLDIDEFTVMANQISMPMLFMTVLVTFMSIFIVNSSFKVITLEKMPHIGTFRSIGASKKIMNRVLFLESLCYGILGGICSCLLGIGILQLLATFVAAGVTDGRATISLVIDPSKMLLTFLLALTICLVSSMLPILKSSKIPIKEIVLNNISTLKKNKTTKYIFAAILLMLSILLPSHLPRSLALLTGTLGMILSIICIIQLLPLIIKVTSPVTEFVFSKLFGNIGTLAVKNIRGNKSMLNSISLLTIGISIILMINTMSSVMNIEVINFYDKTFYFDIRACMDQMDKYAARLLETEDGVDTVVPIYTSTNIYVKELDTIIYELEGIQNASFNDYMKLNLQDSTPELLNKLNEGRYIISTVILKNRYDLKVGDTLTLDFKDNPRSYEIIGFADTMWNNGIYGIIGETYMKLDDPKPYYSYAYIKTSTSPDTVLENLTTKYSNRYFNGATLTQMKNLNAENNAQLMLILIAFSLLAVVIGIVGIINNLLISFIERRQSIAVLRSVGLSKPQTLSMIFLEAIYSSFIGGMIGLLLGALILINVPVMLEGMQLSIPIYLIPETLWVYVVSGIAITVIASITPALRSSKLNIIEAIKFE